MNAEAASGVIHTGLRAFTWFSRVEYANWEEMPELQFLAEVIYCVFIVLV